MIGKLISNIRRTNAPIVVGLDPMMGFVPESIKKAAFAEYGETLEGAAEAIYRFNEKIVNATADLIPAVKPQIAMYEQFGVPGVLAFKKTVDLCKAKGLVVIGDVKRGDIGSTSAAYAAAHLGTTAIGSSAFEAFGEDFATVNPYLGSDGVEPFLKVCRENNRGIFVLVKTSNPSSGEFQDRLVDGRPLYELVGEKVDEWGRTAMDPSPEAEGYFGSRRGRRSNLPGDGQKAPRDHAEILHPGAGLRRPGRKGQGSGQFLQQGRARRDRQFLPRHHCSLEAGEVRRVR